MFRAVLLLISAVVLSTSAQIFVHQPVVSSAECVAKTFWHILVARELCRLIFSFPLSFLSFLSRFMVSVILSSFIQLSWWMHNMTRNFHQSSKSRRDSTTIPKSLLVLRPKAGSLTQSIQCLNARPTRSIEIKSGKSSATRDSWRRSRQKDEWDGEKLLECTCDNVWMIDSYFDWKYIAESFLFFLIYFLKKLVKPIKKVLVILSLSFLFPLLVQPISLLHLLRKLLMNPLYLFTTLLVYVVSSSSFANDSEKKKSQHHRVERI